MKPKPTANEENTQLTRPAMSETGHNSEDNASPAGGATRREFLHKCGLIGAAAGTAALGFGAKSAQAHEDPKPFADIPQNKMKYPASERAKKIVKESMTMDSLFSGVWPEQWSSPEAPEFPQYIDACKAAGFKVLGACPSADSAGGTFQQILKAYQFYLRKLNEHPEKYKIVRTAKDIREAVKESKLGIYFTHQGTQQSEGDLDRVGLFRQLGYGYCLLAYNTRNNVGDGCFEPENAGITGYGKMLIDAYNRYGMIVDVSHCGERLALDAIECSSKPVISSHACAKGVFDYPRNLSDKVIKAVAKSGGVCAAPSRSVTCSIPAMWTS
jgi:membrane dipeptidase